MSDVPTIKLPVWALTLIMALLSALVTSVVYVVETRNMALNNDQRLKNIEEGVHQIWEWILDEQEKGRGR